MIKDIDGEKYESNQEMLVIMKRMKRQFNVSQKYTLTDGNEIVKEGVIVNPVLGHITGVKKNIQEGCWIFKVILRNKDNDLIEYLDSLDFNFSITIGDKT